MDNISNLKPERVWFYFLEICKIPRPSGKEEKIIKYLIDFANKHNLEIDVDESGNVLIKKPAYSGYENRKSVCLQSHLDMVTEKNSDVEHDFNNDPIIPIIDGEWIKAQGTTLGADNGIGVAIQLAILEDRSLKHGPIECLFTVEEETGLVGASKLRKDFIKSPILINLDSEEEGEFIIGCAGGITTTAKMPFKYKKAPSNYQAYKITLSGLKGGHSGDDINKGRANSIKELNRFLWTLSRRINIRLSIFEGGNLSNAIPREAYAIFLIEKQDESRLMDEFNQYEFTIRNEYFIVEPDLKIKIEKIDSPQFVMKRKFQRRLLNAIYGCANGVIDYNKEFENLPETSTNLASIRFSYDDNIITIVTSQRSFTESGKINVMNSVRSVFELAKSKIFNNQGYPGWKPDTSSEILNKAKSTYKEIFGKDPYVRAIHAGLECGIIKEKYPEVDMISMGPTLRNVHSPDERINIKSVQNFYEFLINFISKID